MERDEMPTGEVIELVDEDGGSHPFQILDLVSVDENQYLICTPLEEEEEHEEEAGEAFAFRVNEEEDETYLSEIEDEEEFAQVADEWRRKVGE